MEEDDEVGRTCNRYGRNDKCIQILVGKPKERDHSEDLDVDGSIILERILRK
jgi:hypothetical protein